MPSFNNIEDWEKKHPELEAVIRMRPTLWINPDRKRMSENLSLPLHKQDMEKGLAFMRNYAPFLANIFPETAISNGLIHSPLKKIDHFKTFSNQNNPVQIEGNLLLKCDNELPVAGSIKARGGFFEVLHFAHKLAVQAGFIKEEEVADFSQEKLKALLSKYTIGVGSTGNLGMSIGIISAKIGFKVNVYMSHDAKSWKKKLLREKGAQVIEEQGDFSLAVSRGRRETLSNPCGYFVDDENSRQLFLGYSLAAYEIQQQLKDLHLQTDETHPLFVYSPCGVGGSPGGVLFGLKMLFGDAVHDFFVEPTHAPSVLIGLITGKREKVCVQDFGIDNITEADGLAVGRASAFAIGTIHKLVSGIYTVDDRILLPLLKALYRSEHYFVEPSSTVGLVGPERILASTYIRENHILPKNITHLVWATGGSLVPEQIRESFLQ